jgi:lysophospholipase L1-like esterase
MARPSRNVRDDLLGWVPRPRHVEPGLTIDGEGLRITGEIAAEPDLRPILAVGDSFTFGEHLTDQETWPAALQRLVGRRVLNGGTSGYGFDQIVLRAERLASLSQPAAIVVAFIADDIRRTEMRRLWGRDKPWFALENGQLVAKGLPMAGREPPPTSRVFRLYELLARRLDPRLQHWLGYHVRTHPPGAGEAIACALTRRLAALQRTSGARITLVALYDTLAWQDAREQRAMTGRLLSCAARAGLAVADSFDAFAAQRSPRALYRGWHMNAEGNLLVARLIASILKT